MTSSQDRGEDPLLAESLSTILPLLMRSFKLVQYGAPLGARPAAALGGDECLLAALLARVVRMSRWDTRIAEGKGGGLLGGVFAGSTSAAAVLLDWGLLVRSEIWIKKKLLITFHLGSDWNAMVPYPPSSLGTWVWWAYHTHVILSLHTTWSLATNVPQAEETRGKRKSNKKSRAINPQPKTVLGPRKRQQIEEMD